jgi:hypothetical protein
MLDAAQIEYTVLILDHERHDIVRETFFEHNEAPDAAIPVLKGMYPLELYISSRALSAVAPKR